MLRKEDDNWWRRDCQACKLKKKDAVDCSRWRKFIKDVWWSGWVWVGECFFWYRPIRVVPDKVPLNGCTCVCVLRTVVIDMILCDLFSDWLLPICYFFVNIFKNCDHRKPHLNNISQVWWHVIDSNGSHCFTLATIWYLTVKFGVKKRQQN